MIEEGRIMTSEAYQLFQKSMKIGFDQWHDGIGYDLKALKQLDSAEQAQIEQLLIGNLKQRGDWRDVVALEALGTPAAQTAEDKARFHPNPQGRNYANRFILEKQDPHDADNKKMTELEDQIIQAVADGYFEMAGNLPTLRVKKALLDSTLVAESAVRTSAAAYLLYLCGQAPEPFDWSQRPFFLLFGNDDPQVRQLAWEELSQRTGL